MRRHINPLESNYNLTPPILKSVQRREIGIGWRRRENRKEACSRKGIWDGEKQGAGGISGTEERA